MEKPISDKIQAKLLELRLKYPTPSPEEEERQLHGGYIREAMAEKNIAASRQ